MNAVLFFLAVYYGVSVFYYWLPLLAVRWYPAAALPPDPPASEIPPMLVAVAPCRNGAAAIPGMVACLKKQNYPADRFRILILIDSDTPADPSADIAHAAGAEVYERKHPEIKTKGAAINELLDRRLQQEAWDALLIFDIDARVTPNFLTRVAAHWRSGAQVIQAAPLCKNAHESAVAHISHSAQLLSQLVQRGRSVLGLSAILSGACMVLRRESLERLSWHTSTARHNSDDGELNFRCYLNDLRVTYAPDLQLFNDVPSDVREVRLQRRRWFAAYIEAIPYINRLLVRGLTGHVRALEGLFCLVFLPGSSLAFLWGSLAVLGLGVASLRSSDVVGWFAVFLGIWILHGLYYVVALQTVDGFLSWREFKQLPAFLGVRIVGLVDGAILGSRKNPGHHSIPATPKNDAHPGR